MIIPGIKMYGQSVTVQTEPAPVSYYRMPDSPLPHSYSTYSADISVPYSELSKTNFIKASLVDTYLQLEGYKKVSKNGDVEITATIGDFVIWGEHRSSRRSKTKDKNGKETVKVTYYLELKYSMAMSLEVYTKEGKTLWDRYVFTRSDIRTWNSPSYNNLSDLESYWRIQRSIRLKDLQQDMIKEGLNKILDILNTQFGYKLIRENARFETVGKKKHPAYDQFQTHVEQIQNAFKWMDADKSLEPVKAKLKPALDFYESQAGKYKTGNKDQEKLKHICLYNLALAYYWLEDFDRATHFAKAIQAFDSKDKDARRLLDDIEYTRDSLQRAGRTSRHQVVVGKT